MTSIIAIVSWLTLSFWSLYIWYKSFGGFDKRYGLSAEIILISLTCAPATAIGWTIGYLQERKERSK